MLILMPFVHFTVYLRYGVLKNRVTLFVPWRDDVLSCRDNRARRDTANKL